MKLLTETLPCFLLSLLPPSSVSLLSLPCPQNIAMFNAMCKSKKDTQISSLSYPKASSKPSSDSHTISKSHNTVPSDCKTSLSPSISFSSSSLRTSIPDGPTLYPFFELSTSTTTTTPLSSSTYRCTIRNIDVVVLRRPFLSPESDTLPSSLSALCKGHHRSIIRLVGASLASDHIYLVYKYTPGASLTTCLRNPRNPTFTLLPTWLSRIQILSDLSDALEYIHHHSFTIHNRIKPSAIIVAEPDLRAKLCYFGAAELAGEVVVDDPEVLHRSIMKTNSRLTRVEGTRGYMAPEILAGARATQKSDVFALGVVFLEVVSGEEATKYVMKGKDCCVVSVVDTARAAVREGRVRDWADRRMRDSFPVEVVEKVVRLGLKCVEQEAGERPNMVWVAGKVSRLLLESKAWAEMVVVPTDITVSFGPR